MRNHRASIWSVKPSLTNSMFSMASSCSAAASSHGLVKPENSNRSGTTAAEACAIICAAATAQASATAPRMMLNRGLPTLLNECAARYNQRQPIRAKYFVAAPKIASKKHPETWYRALLGSGFGTSARWCDTKGLCLAAASLWQRRVCRCSNGLLRARVVVQWSQSNLGTSM